MAELFGSYKNSPKVPTGWLPRVQPGAIVKQKIRNPQLRDFLQHLLPGRWMKVYHYGKDGSEIHYCLHESGKVFDVEYRPK